MVIVMDENKEKNMRLCERYPFLIPWNRFSGELITEATDRAPYDYEYTEFDNLPSGWRIAFGEKMCEEIRQALIDDGDLSRWRIVELKEKYGAMRLYDNGHKIGSKVQDIISKYENMSARICICCGKPATKITRGWITPVCDGCCPDKNAIDIDEYYETEEEWI